MVLVVLATLALHGCSSSDGRTGTTDTPVTSPAPVSQPADAETAEPEAADRFIRRWMEVSHQMFVTGDTRDYLALGPDCSDCDRAAASVEGIYSAGGEVRWEGRTLLTLRDLGRPSAHQLRYVVRSAPTRYWESASGPWKTLPGGRSIQFIALRPVGDSWQVLETKELAR